MYTCNTSDVNIYRVEIYVLYNRTYYDIRRIELLYVFMREILKFYLH